MKIIKGVVLILILCLAVHTKGMVQSYSPDHVQRVETIWEWCNCQNGTKEIIIWPAY